MGAFLIAFQTAFTLAIVINATFIISMRIEKMTRPTGMDVENIIALNSQGYKEDFNKEIVTQEDLRLLRSLPGVIDASPTQSIPLSGSGWSSEFTPKLDDETNKTSIANYYVDDHMINTLGIKLESGRNFLPEEISFYDMDNNQTDSVVIITEAAALKLYPDGNALGNPVYNTNGSVAIIVGIIEHMHGAWVGWEGLDRVMLIPKYMHSRYLVRVTPGSLNGLLPIIEEKLLAGSPDRLIRKVKPLSEYLEHSYAMDRAMSIVLGVVVFLLIVVAGLGIISLATFNVNRRIKQIGTRRALGATRSDILNYFLLENWIITTIGIVLGSMLGITFNYWLISSFELPRLDWYFVLGGILTVWVLGLLSVYTPARSASMVSPAIATRNL